MQYRILGPLELRADGTEVQLAPGHQRALLALLLLRRNRVVSMDGIVDALWEDEPPPTAHKVVQNAVSHLRKTLGGSLVTQAPGYLLRVEEGELDADRFTQLVERAQQEEPARAAQTLREALSLWRGPALSDFTYSEFAQPAITQLEELRLEALEDRIDVDLALGADGKLIPELETLVAEHPLRERLRGQLMVALYRGGQQNEALEAYADGRKRLVEQLGLEPGPQLRELEQQILQHDPALGPVARPISSPPAAVRRRQRKVVTAASVLVLAALILSVVSYRELRAGGHSSVSVAGDSTAVIDPASNRVLAGVSVGARPTRIATGEGAVWVVNSNDQTISRIDPQTHATRTFSTASGVVDLAVGAGAVWVTGGPAGIVTRIEPYSTTVQQSISLPRGAGRALAASIAATPKGVWVSGFNYRNGSRPGQLIPLRDFLWQLDPTQTRVVRTVPVRGALGIGMLTLGAGSVWAANQQHLIRFDPRTGKRRAQFSLPPEVVGPTEYSGLFVFANGAIWTASWPDHTVIWRIDARTGRPTGSVTVGGLITGIAYGAGSIWIADAQDGLVLRVDPNRNAIANEIHVVGSPSGLAYGYGKLWVSID